MIVLIVLIALGSILRIVISIAAICSNRYTPPEPKQSIQVDINVKQDPPPVQNPTIAEQFDGRLTNILKNPLEGIL